MVIKRILAAALACAALIPLIRASLILIDTGARESRTDHKAPPGSAGRIPEMEQLIAETEQRIADELSLYMPPPYEDFLDAADTVLEITARRGLNIGSYSLLEEDSRPGMEIAVDGPIENLLAALADLEAAPGYLHVRRISAARKGRGYSASLLIFPAAPRDADEDSLSVIVLGDNMISDARRTARSVFGVRPPRAVKAPPTAPPENPLKEENTPPPASRLSVVGRYAAEGGGYIYAVKDQRSGKIIPMKVGESRGEWRLLSDEDSQLVVEAEGQRHILRWGKGE